MRRLFVGGVGLSFFWAFLSWGAQVRGLVGSDGIVPAASFLERVRAALDVEAYLRVPTVFWLGAGDAALVGACVAGMLAATVVVLGRYERPALVVCWALYLSLSSVGGVFMSFQWDILLLEVALVAVLLAPSARPRRPVRCGWDASSSSS